MAGIAINWKKYPTLLSIPYTRSKPHANTSLLHAIYTFPERTWKSLKGRICVSPLERSIRESKATDDGVIHVFMKGLTSPQFPYLQGSLKKLWKSLSDTQKHEVLSFTAMKEWEGHPDLYQRIIGFLTLSEMKQILKQQAPNIQIVIENLVKLSKHLDKAEPEALFTPPRQNALTHFIKKIINTITITISLLQKGKEPDSYFEGAYLLEIFYKMIFIPVTVCVFLFQLCSLPVSLTITAATIVSVYIFTKVVDKPIILPDFCLDLTQLAREGKIKPILGRDEEIDKLLVGILSKASARPLMVGDSRVGKTTIAETLACLMQNAPQKENPFLKKYPELANKRLILVKTTALIPMEGQEYKIPNHQKLMDAIGQDDIVFFDDLQAILNNSNIADKLNHDLPQVYFGATTTDGEKHIYQNPSLSRRFGDRILIENMNEVNCCRILKKKAEEEAPEMEFTTEALEALYHFKEKEKQPEPWRSLNFLSWIIAEIRKNNTKKLFEKIDQCRQDLNEKKAKLPHVVDGNYAAKAKPLLEDFAASEELLQKAKKQMKAEKSKTKKFMVRKAYWQDTSNQMVELAEGIYRSKDKTHPEVQDATLHFLYVQFFRQPALESWLYQNKNHMTMIDTVKMQELLANIKK